MQRSLRPRETSTNLSESTLRRLNMYALAAGSAGVGMLALTPRAEAKIVYTPAHIAISRTSKISIDLNHDRKSDFDFLQTFLTTTSVDENHSLILSVLPRGKNEIWGTGNKANALVGGVKIGPKSPFLNAKQAMAVAYYADGTGGSGTCAGPWNNVKNRYLGFKFKINGKTHFGWARLNVSCVTTYGNHVITGTLTGYAYETIPNKPIITGVKMTGVKMTGVKKSSDSEDFEGGLPASASPSSTAMDAPAGEQFTLGWLAMGAPALSVRGRKEQAELASTSN